MQKKLWSKVVVGAVLTSVVALGCSGPTAYKPKPAPPIEPVDLATITKDNLVPITLGSEWDYAFESQATTAAGTEPREGRMRFTVTDVKAAADGQRVSFSVTQDDIEVDRQVWLINDKGIYQLSSGIKPIPYNPPQPLVFFPVKDGDKREWKGKGLCPDASPGTMRSTITVRGTQTVDTNVGQRPTVLVETAVSYQSEKSTGVQTVSTYYQPGVGIVRLKQQLAVRGGVITTTLKLNRPPQ